MSKILVRFTVTASLVFAIASLSFAALFNNKSILLFKPAALESAFLTPNSCDTAGPIEVEGTTAGTTPTAYATLGAAFAAINAGTHKGAISIDVCGDTNEGSSSAVLTASGSGSSLYSSITIVPAGGATRSISGSTTAGLPLIDLNGADNVTINGLNSSGNSLTIQNLTVSASSGTSTIRFVGDATNNTISNSTILGSATVPMTANGGTIFFAALAAASGNDNNTISNNNIGPAGANVPSKAIYSSGTTTNSTLYNSGIAVTGNNIFDFFLPGGASAGVYLNGGTTDWTISNNKIFQTAVRTQTAGAVHAGIQIANTNINNCTISGNTIGYASSSGSGIYTFVGASTGSRFYPIYISAHGTAAATSIEGNTIAGISISGPGSGIKTGSPFAGIMIASGIANIGDTTGNIIGSQSVPGSINVNSTATGDSDVFGIAFFAAANVTISNNSVGGIAATNSNLAPGAIDLYGIRADTNGSSTNTIQNNIIGASAAPVNNNAASASSNTYGIYSLTGTPALSNNTVSNLTMAAGNVGTDTSASMIGISVDASSASGSALVSENVIRNLNNSSAAAAVVVTGMVYSGGVGGPDIVERNFIHSIGNASSNASAQISGIIIVGGSSDFRNNMIAIGNSVTTGPIINGIIETGSASDNIYFNSVYIGGINNGPTVANTFAFNSPVITNIRNYRDNIFFNARTNGSGTGRHYAIQLGGSSSNPTGLISNNNILYASGNGGYTGRYNSVDRVTLANWQTATGQDGNSFSASPLFIAPSATMPDLHIQPASGSIVESNGFNTGVIDDFDGQTRSTLSPVDIGADAGNFVAVVLNHGTLSFTSTSFSGSEGSSTLNISVQRTGGTDGAVSVPISVSDTTATGGAACSGGIDFVNTATTISFNDAEGGTKSYSVPVCQDSIYEGNETFSALLGNPTGGASVGGTNPATVTILDDDSAPAIQFSAPTYVEDESQTLQLTVTRSGDTSGTSTVDLDTSGGDAVGGASCTAGVDYITTNISGLAFGPSETSKLVQIPICSDMQSETTETFGITLSNPGGSGATLGSPASATVSINDTASEYRSTDTIAFNGKGPAAPYPSNILVSGAPSAIGSMRVTLYDVQASFADDIDILLVGPQGQTLILMSDAGGSDGLGLPATVTFSDAAAVSLPDSGTTSTGGYRATNWAPDPDSFLGAPAGPYGDPATLTNPFGQTFTGTDPNGTWSLYVINDNESGLASGAADGIAGGWGIEFFGTTAAQGNISGHVMSADGLGIRNATVTVSGRSLHEPLSIKTNGSGKYSVGGLSVATDYVVSVEAKGFSFPTPTVLMRFTGDAKETNFTAEQSKKGR